MMHKLVMGHFYRYCLESSLILVRSEVYLLYLIFELKCIEVVVYEGMVREKPSSKEEARQFIKDYSGGHAATVGSVIITNLKTGFRKGGWDKVEISIELVEEKAVGKVVERGRFPLG
ncbi:hypothetical protein CK203_007939 [Vitis vinifera]|uniref:Uncharacterized protein n=1 Tax=Vitis vinifera TaxID=29760 RepID=A0A438K270_VITVI|nr:hypothetical protein CK203_007939 [Vitis vinifera]